MPPGVSYFANLKPSLVISQQAFFRGLREGTVMNAALVKLGVASVEETAVYRLLCMLRLPSDKEVRQAVGMENVNVRGGQGKVSGQEVAKEWKEGWVMQSLPTSSLSVFTTPRIAGPCHCPPALPLVCWRRA